MSGFDLRHPCRNCPFRSDIKPFLRYGRAAALAAAIQSGATFSCHKTVEYSDAEPRETDRTQQCAGALIICEKEGHLPQMARIAERLGMYDRHRLEMDASVYGSFAEFVAAHREPVPS